MWGKDARLRCGVGRLTMSITEVDQLLKVSVGHSPCRMAFSLRQGFGVKTWNNGTCIITAVTVHPGCSITFWTDLITQQCRVFVDSELKAHEGKLLLDGGGEIAPPEWN